MASHRSRIRRLVWVETFSVEADRPVRREGNSSQSSAESGKDTGGQHRRSVVGYLFPDPIKSGRGFPTGSMHFGCVRRRVGFEFFDTTLAAEFHFFAIMRHHDGLPHAAEFFTGDRANGLHCGMFRMIGGSVLWCGFGAFFVGAGGEAETDREDCGESQAG
jgi:hypothetical protein